MYGDAEATKLSLFKMKRDSDFERFRVEAAADASSESLEGIGFGPNPSIAYWKRSPTGAHPNAVFVGKVFDTCMLAIKRGALLSPST